MRDEPVRSHLESASVGRRDTEIRLAARKRFEVAVGEYGQNCFLPVVMPQLSKEMDRLELNQCYARLVVRINSAGSPKLLLLWLGLKGNGETHSAKADRSYAKIKTRRALMR